MSGRRGLLVLGPQDDPALPAAAAACAAACGFPILADPLSGARAGGHDLSRVIAAADPLAAAGWLGQAPPEVVVRVGALPTSKPLWQWLGEHPEVPQALIDPAGWRDPGATLSLMVRAEPAATLEALAAAAPRPAPAAWLEAWQQADGAAAAAVDGVLAEAAFPNEPEVVRVLAEALPAGALLAVASSMPIRDVDAFFPARPAPLRLLGNRGAAGIDGFLSTGLGAAAVAGAPAYLLSGDLSALHDLTALGTAARLGIAATIVVVHNDGGGIFHFLPQAGFPAHFERHWGTPHGTRLRGRGAGLRGRGRPGGESRRPGRRRGRRPHRAPPPRGAHRPGGQLRPAPPLAPGRRGGPAPASDQAAPNRPSIAPSLRSVSAASAAGSDPATMPAPA